MTRVPARKDGGFTTLELGITLCILAVLATIVLLARGFLDAARQQATIVLVQSVRSEAREWSKRNCASLSYRCTMGGAVRQISKAELSSNLVSSTSPTNGPWMVGPSSAGGACSGDACAMACVSLPNLTVAHCEDVRRALLGLDDPAPSPMPGVIGANCDANGNSGGCTVGGTAVTMRVVVQ
jgi:hypothetical protein